MRFISVATAFYTGFLIAVISLSSACRLINLIETELCASVCDNPRNGKEPLASDADAGCGACCSVLNIICFGFYESQNGISFTQWGRITGNYCLFSTNLSSSYIADCWHPPEIA
jgi:hypothetical protein